MKWLNRAERWMYRFQVRPFFLYVILAMAGIYALELFIPRSGLYSRLILYTPLVYAGQLWRIFTFLLLPPMGSPLFVLLSLYFYYFIGTSLETRWGARRFLLFLIIGALGAIFAVLYPEMQVLLFFIIPVKVKWLALLNAAYFLYAFITGNWAMRAAILFSLANVFFFFGGDMINLIRSEVEQFRRRQKFRNSFRR